MLINHFAVHTCSAATSRKRLFARVSARHICQIASKAQEQATAEREFVGDKLLLEFSLSQLKSTNPLSSSLSSTYRPIPTSELSVPLYEATAVRVLEFYNFIAKPRVSE